MIKRLVVCLLILLIAGCAGVTSRMTDGYKFEEIWSVGLFTPTYQYKRVSQCQVVEGRTVEPCVPIGKGFTVDVSGPVAPAIISGASNVASGAIISDGLRDSDGTVNSITTIAGDTINGNQHGHGKGNGK